VPALGVTVLAVGEPVDDVSVRRLLVHDRHAGCFTPCFDVLRDAERPRASAGSADPLQVPLCRALGDEAQRSGRHGYYAKTVTKPSYLQGLSGSGRDRTQTCGVTAASEVAMRTMMDTASLRSCGFSARARAIAHD
jgi:hypothetical protein